MPTATIATVFADPRRRRPRCGRGVDTPLSDDEVEVAVALLGRLLADVDAFDDVG